MIDYVKENTNLSSKSLLESEQELSGNTEKIVSTGSTLLDLAISGGRIKGGGIPSGILVEIFGAPSTGKTVLLCEIAGNVKRKSGEVMFFDPEGRLNKEFAKLFGLDIKQVIYSLPDTVREVFAPIRNWNPEPSGAVHGIFADSLAALSTDWELEGKDEYGMRRAKEFSEELRKTCRILKTKDYLMVCSNQIRQNLDAGPFGQKYKSPGGEAIGFYSSLRLRTSLLQKLAKVVKIHGKEHKTIIGIVTEVEVVKSSVWKPWRKAEVYILFDYGIDDIRANLQFIKTLRGLADYCIGERRLSRSIDEAIVIVEEERLEKVLRDEVIGLWEELENATTIKRAEKQRF